MRKFNKIIERSYLFEPPPARSNSTAIKTDPRNNKKEINADKRVKNICTDFRTIGCRMVITHLSVNDLRLLKIHKHITPRIMPIIQIMIEYF